MIIKKSGQDTNKFQYSITNNQTKPVWLFVNWSLVIILFLFLVSWLLPIPASALDNPEQALTEAVEDYVMTKYPDWIGYDIKVTFKYADKIFENLRKLEGDVDFEVIEVYRDFKPVGNVIFPIEVTTATGRDKIFIRAKVEVFKNIVVAVKKIMRGEEILAEDLTLEERDIAALPQRYLESLEQVISSEAKTTIPKNSTIFEWMIKEKPLVHRGDVVAVLVTAPNLTVKATGVVLEDGYLGKNVKVKRQESKITLEGRLITSNEVEVKLK